MKKHFIISILFSLFITGCAYDPYTGEQQISSAGLGAALGAASGAVIGSVSGSDGALLGAGIGALAGGMIGNSIDRQEAILRHHLSRSGVQVIRVNDDIHLVMPGE